MAPSLPLSLSLDCLLCPSSVGGYGWRWRCGVGARVWVCLVSDVVVLGVLVVSDADAGVFVADLVALDEVVFFVELLLWLEAYVADIGATVVDLFSFGAMVVSFGSWSMVLLEGVTEPSVSLGLC
ncbi:hypothetical protein SUGI_0537330 [Cryptomeria japonica]|nr:hypothetical protein SUGI_0537330 [Cryptomeria japonica]